MVVANYYFNKILNKFVRFCEIRKANSAKKQMTCQISGKTIGNIMILFHKNQYSFSYEAQYILQVFSLKMFLDCS